MKIAIDMRRLTIMVNISRRKGARNKGKKTAKAIITMTEILSRSIYKRQAKNKKDRKKKKNTESVSEPEASSACLRPRPGAGPAAGPVADHSEGLLRV